MTAIVVGMILVVVVAFVVLSVFSEEEEEEWSHRKGTDSAEGTLDDLLEE